MMMAQSDSVTGVVLMSFGSPRTPAEVPAYLKSVRRGSDAPADTVAEFQRRYRLVGGSPLNRITAAQAAALEAALNEAGEGRFHVAVGMRHATPWIAEAFEEMAHQGIARVIAIIMSPQYSPIIMGGYHQAVEAARPVLGARGAVTIAGAWHTLPAFLEAMACRVREALDGLPESERATLPVIFTAHSLPRPVVDREPAYIDQLKETARLVAARVGLPPEQWQFAYQSAGHTAQEWLRPDIKELFPDLRQAGHTRVLIAPIQFLADHLEILYDIDIAAREEADAAGIQMRRIETFNTMPAFITALADVVRRELA